MEAKADVQQAGSDQRQRRSRTKVALIGGLVVLLAVGVFLGIRVLQAKSDAKSKATCENDWVYCTKIGGSWKPDPTRNRIRGVFELTDSDGYKQSVGSSCSGSDGYSDIVDGTQVTVSNETGKIIATGRLSNGKVTSSETSSFNRRTTTKCSWDIEVEQVPRASVYQVEVSHRGELRYSLDEMKAQGWTVGFTLGD